MPKISARWMLAIVSFFLFLIAQMNRVNINIAIVTMEERYFGNNWDAKVIVMGAYYWCYSLIELPGTFFLRKYGCRNILTINVFICGLTNFIFPSMYIYHPLCGIFIRAIQGLLLGITWPAIAVMSAKWIPKQERSKFTSTYQGTSVGSSLTYALGGVIIYNLGWAYLFYLTGILSILWTLLWWFYAFDSPAEHPRISLREKNYIESSIGDQGSTQAIPWKEMFTSKPFWSVFIATFGIMWFVVTINMQLPVYLHDVHEVNIRTNGLLLCIPDIVNYMFSLSFSIFIDKQIKSEFMSLTAARKIATIFSHIVPATVIIILGMFGYRSIGIAMILAIVAVASGGATSSGNLANIVDISPNNAGIVMGISKTMCIVPGVMSPIIVKYFTAEDHQNWLPVFVVTSVILISTSMIYFIFGSGEIQDWDSKKIDADKDQKEEENKSLMYKTDISKQDTEIIVV